MSELEIRPFRELEEYRACVRLQEETWGEGFSEKVPAALLMVGQRLGGVAAGAFDPEGQLVGFVFGITGWEDGVPVHWSDMLAVRAGHRGRGVGIALKAFQRSQLLERGVRMVHWTFDPLETLNGYLNFGKLGAVAREYVPNMYGTTGSALHGDLPTDRFVVSWLIDSDRVRARLEEGEKPPGVEAVGGAPRALSVEMGVDGPTPVGFDPGVEEPRVLVPVPVDFGAVRAGAPKLARRWREATSEAFGELIGRGYEVRELVRGEDLSDYLLVRPGAGGVDGN